MEDDIRPGSLAHHLALIFLDEATKSPLINGINLGDRISKDPKMIESYFKSGEDGLRQYQEDLQKVLRRYQITGHPENEYVMIMEGLRGLGDYSEASSYKNIDPYAVGEVLSRAYRN